jgi:hypothetical protein
MKHLINAQYCTWLKRYKKLTKNPQTLKIADELLCSIPTTLTTQELINLFAPYTKPIHSNPADVKPNPVYGPIEFYSTLLTWQSQLKTLQTLQQNALATIAIIKPQSPTTIPVLSTLTELITEPLVLLHTEGSKLLCLINHSNFKEIIKLLTPLKITEPTKYTSFHYNKEYCHYLLLALRTEIKEGDKTWVQANQLLELILDLYQEYNALVEIDLDCEESEEPPLERKKEHGCVII